MNVPKKLGNKTIINNLVFLIPEKLLDKKGNML